jgi:4-hydroxy-L-threonine phosphate dehydrogenase PdxA
VDAVIGCPHSETAIHRVGISLSGYPDLIAELTGTPSDRVFLLLVSPELKIAHVTLHERLHNAIVNDHRDYWEATEELFENCRCLAA